MQHKALFVCLLLGFGLVAPGLAAQAASTPSKQHSQTARVGTYLTASLDGQKKALEGVLLEDSSAARTNTKEHKAKEKQTNVAQYYRRRRRRGMYRTRNTRTGWLVAGIITLSVFYGTTLMIALPGTLIASSGNDDRTAAVFGTMLIPGVGPFISLGLAYAFAGNNSAAQIGVYVATPFLVINGLAQLGAIAMIIVGATGNRRVRVYDDRRGRATTPPPPVMASAQGPIYNLGQF